MRTVPSIDFIWVYLQYCSAISWWVNWNLSNRTSYSNSFFSQHYVHANSNWGETLGRGGTSSPEIWTRLTTGMANTIFMSTKFAAGKQSQNWFNVPVFLPRQGACALQGCFGCLPSKNLFAVFTVSAVCVNKGLLQSCNSSTMGPDWMSVVLQPNPQGEGMGTFASTRQSNSVDGVLHMLKGHVIKF